MCWGLLGAVYRAGAVSRMDITGSMDITELLQHQRVCVVGCGVARDREPLLDIPIALYRDKWTDTECPVVCSTRDPRSLARLACVRFEGQLWGHEMGDICGFRDLLEESASRSTRIIYSTHERVLHDMLNGRYRELSVLVVDYTAAEALAEVLLFHAKHLLLRSPRLRVVVLARVGEDQDTVVGYFGGLKQCALVTLQPARPEIRLAFVEPEADAVACVARLVRGLDGNVLIFVPDDALGTQIAEALEEANEFVCYFHDRNESIPVNSVKKAIITSKSVPDSHVSVKYVIDFGWKAGKVFDAEHLCDKLETVRVSKTEASTRAQSVTVAGGCCYRVYPKQHLAALPDSCEPEMETVNPTTILLTLLALHYPRIGDCDTINNVNATSIAAVAPVLHYMDVMDEEGRLTDVGRSALALPLPIQYARLVVEGVRCGCGLAVLKIVCVAYSLLTASSASVLLPSVPQRTREALVVEEGDHMVLLNIFNAFLNSHCSPKWCQAVGLRYAVLEAAGRMYEHLRAALANQQLLDSTDHVRIRQCVAAGLFYNAAVCNATVYNQQPSPSYKCLRTGRQLWVHPSSFMRHHHQPKLVVYDECVEERDGRPEIRFLSAVHPDWLAPDDHSGFYFVRSKRK